jgi:threonine dehydratase
VQPLALPTLDAVRAAAERVRGVARRTPLYRLDTALPTGSPRAGLVELHLKLENLQPIGSFKIRGAANAMAVARPEALERGVWTASAGNMAQGVAWCAHERGLGCRVVVPEQAPRAKLERVAALGAEIERVPFEAWWNAMRTGRHPGMDGLMVHPFADTDVMAGNGTIALELVEEAPELDAVLVPWGGGGLALGIAATLRAVSPRTKVYAVEIETAAPLTPSLAAGKPVTVTRTPSWVDGMGSDRVAEQTWPLVRGLIAGTVVVTLADVARALKLVAETAHVIAEGAGAAAVAAALHGRLNGEAGAALEARRVACIVSGGNVNPEIVARILAGEIP